MKKVAAVLFACLILIWCSGGICESVELPENLEFGWTKEDVLVETRKNGSVYNKHNYIETNIADQAYTMAFLHFADDGMKTFDTSAFSSDMEYMGQQSYLYSFATFDIEVAQKVGKFDPTEEYTLEETDANKQLVQIQCVFTSDFRYSGAVETFEDVEKYLTNKYGTTRYTSRRGEYIYPCVGYDGALLMIETDYAQVPYYSQRILDCGEYSLIVDHHIVIYNKTFMHELTFSQSPIDLK